MIDIGDGQMVEIGSKEHADAILRAVDGRNDLVHAVLKYQCRSCRHVEDIYLGVGVAGPPKLIEAGLYIPCPFMGQRCLLCGGETAHSDFSGDRQFEPIDAPAGVRYYRVPRTGVNMRYFMSSAYCGETARAPGAEPPGGWMRSVRAG